METLQISSHVDGDRSEEEYDVDGDSNEEEYEDDEEEEEIFMLGLIKKLNLIGFLLLSNP